MTHRAEDGTTWIVAEPPGRCQLCGEVGETRPYGPGGAQVCFSCGKADEEETERQAGAFMFGIGEHPLPPLPGREVP